MGANRIWILCIVCLTTVITNRPNRAESPQPLSPELSASQTHVRIGYRLELVAAEPLIQDPVAIDWGADGRLWVVEMADYPSGMDGQGKPGGRIRVLEDHDGDGRYDTSTIFLDNLNFPNGILTWRDGVLISAAPQILFARDTDGDMRADETRVLYSGFLEGNQQLRVNGLRLGLDNWVHCASGSHHAGYGAQRSITSNITGAQAIIGSRDFRIRPEYGGLEATSGPSQFGRNRDDWGNWFGVQNSHPLWHYVLEDRYLRRNVHLVPPDVRHQVVVPTNPPVYPAHVPQKRFHSFEHAGRFTSACSAMIDRDQLLFSSRDEENSRAADILAPAQHAFTCEPFHSLVQHNVITPDGVSFVAQRDSEDGDLDFFASKDRWVRPVMVRTGPDGALWVVDMYRYMIEHPEWLTPEGREELKPFYRLGDTQGRIYRILPAEGKPRSVPKLSELSLGELAEQLANPNGWVRDKAQQLIVDAKDASVVGTLVELAQRGDTARGRLHALCTLDGLNAVPEAALLQSLGDPHPALRRHAIRIAERAWQDSPLIRERLVELTEDDDPQVRLQLACSLGELNGDDVSMALNRLLSRASGEPYTTAAVLSSLSAANVGSALLAAVESDQLDVATLATLVRMAVVFDQKDGLVRALDRATDRADGTSRQALSRRFRLFAAFLEGAGYHQIRLHLADSHVLDQIMVDAVYQAERQDVPLADRQLALRLVGHEPQLPDASLRCLTGLLRPTVAAALTQQAIARLATRDEDVVGRILIEAWKSTSPALRGHLADAILGRTKWTRWFVSSIESGSIAIAELEPVVRQRLLSRFQGDDRVAIQKILQVIGSEDREHLLVTYRAAESLPADAEQGRHVFAKNCASCHKLNDLGQEIGPNLMALSDKTYQTMLVSILDPNRVVETKYLRYDAATTDGRILTGMVVGETGASLTLLTSEGTRIELLRSELDELRSTGQSLMPDGFERVMTPTDVANLVEFVRAAH